MDHDLEKKQDLPDSNMAIDETMPHQIEAPDFKQSIRSMEPPFVNEHGVVIGDSKYNSPESPLNNWSTETDPVVMAGDQWVHPTNDIGWNTPENRDLLQNIQPKGAPFMHPTIDVSKGTD